MKKIIAIILTALMLVLTLTACSSGKTLDDVKTAGKLVVATSPDFPPFENLEGSEVVGIEVDLMKLICEKLGVELELVQADFDSVLAGVQACKYDCGMSGITVTEKRQKNMLFTTPYCLAAQCIVVSADSAITSKKDLEGKSISVQTSTTAEEFCMAAGYDVKSFSANADAKLALTTGKVDAWVVDDLTAAEMCAEDATVKILDEKMTTEPYALAFAFGSETLVEEIDKIIKEFMADGTVANLFAKHNAPYTAPSAN